MVLLMPLAAHAELKVGVPISNQTDVTTPPACGQACAERFDLPDFARKLALSGPDGAFETALDRRTFLTRIEDWRRFAELYRKTVEQKQRMAVDWRAANVGYQVELAKYEQFFESYRNAFAMDRAGTIRYGAKSE
ncbi:MAG: hypothetical protein H2045_03845 [Rhizobiales bacterium]|nr:hypothetical protein [Hyphomicrobiales bacterium]